MLLPHIEKINSYKTLLASGSGTRQRLLKWTGVKFDIRPTDFPEDLDKANFETTQAYVKENAHQKLLASLTDVKSYNLTYDIIIAGDSILSYQNKVFEKPKSEQEAKQRLALLSGQVCQFYTCVYLAVLKDGEYKIDEILVGTDIHMAELSEEVIDAYVATGEPFGKALGFGIGAEEMGGTFVSKIDGCYYNTWGFPLPAFAKKLRDLLKDLEMIQKSRPKEEQKE